MKRRVCEDCALVVATPVKEDEYGRELCPDCEGVLLDIQEAGDKILALKSELRDVLNEEEIY